MPWQGKLDNILFGGYHQSTYHTSDFDCQCVCGGYFFLGFSTCGRPFSSKTVFLPRFSFFLIFSHVGLFVIFYNRPTPCIIHILSHPSSEHPFSFWRASWANSLSLLRRSLHKCCSWLERQSSTVWPGVSQTVGIPLTLHVVYLLDHISKRSYHVIYLIDHIISCHPRA